MPKRNRPHATNAEPAQDISTGSVKSVPIVPQVTGPTHEAQRRATGYAVVVHNGDRWRRALYFSLHSATQAADRARARGADPYLQLVELVPVGDVQR